MFRPRVPRRHAEISTDSMADIAFLLIVFFIVTAVFAAHQGLVLENAGKEEPRHSDPGPSVYIKVLGEGAILIDDKPTTPDVILPYLAPKLRRWPEKPVLMYTVPEAPFSAMIRVYDELMRAQLPPADGGLGLPEPIAVSIPTEREVAAYRSIFGRDLF